MTFGLAALTVGGIGLGLSAASAAGAFNGKVDNWMPTPQEMEAARRSKQVFALSQELQQPLDGLARKDLEYMNSPAGFEQAASLGVNDFFRGKDINAPINSAAPTSGGPGSGRWWSGLSDTKTALDSGLYGANVGGRLTGLNKYVTGTNQFLGRRAGDLNAGLSAMTSGGQQSAQAQADRISAQIGRNVATSSAMSGLGNTMIGAASGIAGMGKK
jgi:hypothetical protein